ncbi:MAG TPA: 30S ribosomal protein S20 [Tissierellaceae bacterium]|nr:30S ribosomal protein S20 [Tissierellaceae bacterium]
MANIKSAEKRIRTTAKKTVVNKKKRSELKTYMRRFDEAVESGNLEEAGELLKIVDKHLKKASYNNLIHKNNASRKLSKLTKKLNNAM